MMEPKHQGKRFMEHAKSALSYQITTESSDENDGGAITLPTVETYMLED